MRGVYPDASESDRTQLKSYIEAFLAQKPEDTPGLTDWQNAYNVLKKDEETIATKQAAVSEKQADVRAKQTALQEARADASNADGTADSKRQNIQNKLDKAQADLSAAYLAAVNQALEAGGKDEISLGDA